MYSYINHLVFSNFWILKYLGRRKTKIKVFFHMLLNFRGKKPAAAHFIQCIWRIFASLPCHIHAINSAHNYCGSWELNLFNKNNKHIWQKHLWVIFRSTFNICFNYCSPCTCQPEDFKHTSRHSQRQSNPSWRPPSHPIRRKHFSRAITLDLFLLHLWDCIARCELLTFSKFGHAAFQPF